MKKQKQSIRKKIYKVLLIILSVATVYSFAAPKFLNDNIAYAVGDLTINWGVPTGNPIFVVTNMMPGDVEQRSVGVVNNAAVSRTVAVRGVKTSESLNFSTILDFVILDGVTPIYGTGSSTGPKTLAQFFTDSAGVNGIGLSTLAPSASTTYTFKATFDASAGNEFQNAQVIFDLIIGIGFGVPAECSFINFSGNPIFGTSGNDNIQGTNRNDLIIAFEGNDKVDASNGDDCIIGGPGNDKLDASNGNDVVFGNEGNDTLDGSNGNDLLIAGSGDDKLDGSNGNDRMFGEEGNDVFDGSNGDDYMIGGPGNDKFDASNGNDYVEGNDGNDTMNGGNGNDTLLGGPAADKANGNLGRDTCDAETEISCEI